MRRLWARSGARLAAWRDHPGSIGLAVALLGAVLVAAMGSGYTASRALLHDGSAWLTKGQRIVHVNGATGRPDAEVARDLAKGDETIQVVQTPEGHVYVVNKETNEVQRIDLANMVPDPNARLEPGGPPQDVELLASGGQAYLVRRGDGRVEPVDPLTLAPQGSVAVPGGVADAEVDGKGGLWAASRLGTVLRVEGNAADPPVRVATPGDELAVAMVGDTPVVANLTAGHVRRMHPESGALGEPIALPGGAREAVLNTFGNRGPWLWLARSDGSVLRVDLDRGRVDTVTVGGGGSSFGPPVVNDGRVYVPDYAHHTVVVLDAGALRKERTLPVAGTAPRFDAFVKNGAVWVNDPTGPAALLIDGAGRVKEVDKRGRGERGDDAGQALPRPAEAPAGARPAPGRSEARGAPVPLPVPSAASVPGRVPPPPQQPKATVPGVVGQLLEAACGQVRAASLNCAPKTTNSAPGGTRRGQVVAQQPPAGSKVDASSNVTLTVYDPDRVAVPAVSGSTPDEACGRVRQAGLVCQPSDRGTAPSGTRPGEINAVSPPEGQLVDPGTTVTVSYYSTTPVPDVRGQSPAQACSQIQVAGLRCRAEDQGRGQPSGQITAENPAPGTPVQRNTLVVVRYFGAAPRVPNVVGKAKDEACRILREAGYVCDAQVERNDTPPNEVFRQSPAAGREANTGTTVTVLYERYVTGRIGNWPAPTGVWRNPNADQKIGEVPQGSAVTIDCKKYTGVAGDGWWYKILRGRSWPAGWIVRADVVRTNGNVPDC